MRDLNRTEMRKKVIKVIRRIKNENFMDDTWKEAQISGYENSLALLNIITMSSWERLMRATKKR